MADGKGHIFLFGGQLMIEVTDDQRRSGEQRRLGEQKRSCEQRRLDDHTQGDQRHAGVQWRALMFASGNSECDIMLDKRTRGLFRKTEYTLLVISTSPSKVRVQIDTNLIKEYSVTNDTWHEVHLTSGSQFALRVIHGISDNDVVIRQLRSIFKKKLTVITGERNSRRQDIRRRLDLRETDRSVIPNFVQCDDDEFLPTGKVAVRTSQPSVEICEIRQPVNRHVYHSDRHVDDDYYDIIPDEAVSSLEHRYVGDMPAGFDKMSSCQGKESAYVTMAPAPAKNPDRVQSGDEKGAVNVAWPRAMPPMSDSEHSDPQTGVSTHRTYEGFYHHTTEKGFPQ